ncbi:uncharacterized protein ZBAI_05052 [Zygosaccharomyces bailii ISA1307]|nr:uncharacterized protein ZBAI_05052 [Zygosaccharomyces bailii ISA1307]
MGENLQKELIGGPRTETRSPRTNLPDQNVMIAKHKCEIIKGKRCGGVVGVSEINLMGENLQKELIGGPRTETRSPRTNLPDQNVMIAKHKCEIIKGKRCFGT